MQLQTLLISALVAIVVIVVGIIILLPAQAPLPIEAISVPTAATAQTQANIQPPTPMKIQAAPTLTGQSESPSAPVDIQPLGKTATGPDVPDPTRIPAEQ